MDLVGFLFSLPGALFLEENSGNSVNVNVETKLGKSQKPLLSNEVKVYMTSVMPQEYSN